MRRGTVCRIECAAVVLVFGSVGLAQDPHSLPDAPSTVLMREKMSSSASQSQVAKEVRAPNFLPSAQSALLCFQAAPLAPQNDAEKLSAIGHSLLPALPMHTQQHSESSDSEGTFSRATRAVSRVLLAHDSQGRTQANSAYLLGAMAASFFDTARQPYNHHAPTDVLGNFGSTVGGAAGMNLFNEFWPQLKKGLSSRIPRALQRKADLFKAPQP